VGGTPSHIYGKRNLCGYGMGKMNLVKDQPFKFDRTESLLILFLNYFEEENKQHKRRLLRDAHNFPS